MTNQIITLYFGMFHAQASCIKQNVCSLAKFGTHWNYSSRNTL